MSQIEPFVRWAGGKTWLIPYLPEIMGNINIEHYHEPFLGGAAAMIITSVLSMIFDSLFVILQRYNRPKLIKVMERFPNLRTNDKSNP